MKKIILLSLIVVLAISSCKKKKNPPLPTTKSEYLSYKLGATSFSIPMSTVTKDLSNANGYVGFYIGESTRSIYIDAEIQGGFIVNQAYNSNTLAIQIGINDNNPNRLTDTFFNYATFIVTYEDNTWIQGEFTANDCKVKNLQSNQISNIPSTLTDGKFSFKK